MLISVISLTKTSFLLKGGSVGRLQDVGDVAEGSASLIIVDPPEKPLGLASMGRWVLLPAPWRSFPT